MNLPRLSLFHVILTGSSIALLACSAFAAEKEPQKMSAPALAERLDTDREPGTTYVRLRLSTGETVLQLQIKERRTADRLDRVYQVLFPRDRKGEAVLLQKTNGQPATGVLFTPPGNTQKLSAADMKKAFFDSALTYEDLIANFFAWDQQALAGTDEINRVKCLILESKPGKSEQSSYSKVRSWVDTRRMVPLRVEKYNAAGEVERRIDTTRVGKGPGGRPIPSNLKVQETESGKVSELDGSRINHDVIFSDEEFTPEGLKLLSPPKGAPTKAGAEEE